DEETLAYLKFSGRGRLVDRARAYLTEQGMFRTDASPDPEFSDTLELDLGAVEPSLAGPKRPQDRVPLQKVKSISQKTIADTVGERSGAMRGASGEAVPSRMPASIDKGTSVERTVPVKEGPISYELGHGAVVIAAITSCTN